MNYGPCIITCPPGAENRVGSNSIYACFREVCFVELQYFKQKEWSQKDWFIVPNIEVPTFASDLPGSMTLYPPLSPRTLASTSLQASRRRESHPPCQPCTPCTPDSTSHGADIQTCWMDGQFIFQIDVKSPKYFNLQVCRTHFSHSTWVGEVTELF